MTAKIGNKEDCRIVTTVVGDAELKDTITCTILAKKGMINSFVGLLAELDEKASKIVPVKDVVLAANGAVYKAEYLRVGDTESTLAELKFDELEVLN